MNFMSPSAIIRPDESPHTDCGIGGLEMQNHGNSGSAYGDLYRISPGRASQAEAIHRVHLNSGRNAGGVSENYLCELFFKFPQGLPIHHIDRAYDGVIPVCREMSLQAGGRSRLDALYVNPQGRLTLAEFKLWRNQQSRREVVGQILDYAKDLATWSYEDLQREVSQRRGETGNALYELARQQQPELRESEFVDNVTRHLKNGEFLLLIVGDGIRGDLQNLVTYIDQPSQPYKLALVEAAIYRDQDNTRFVQPRVLAKVEVVNRDYMEQNLVLGKLDAIDDKLAKLIASAEENESPVTQNDGTDRPPLHFAHGPNNEGRQTIQSFYELESAKEWVNAAPEREFLAEEDVVERFGWEQVEAYKNLRWAERDLQQAQAQVEQGKAEVEQAKAELARIRRMRQDGA